MNDAGPKKSGLGVNVTLRPSVVADPAAVTPTDVTVSPRPSGSRSLPSTATLTAWPWFVVAWSPWAWGGGAAGAVTVSETVAAEASPAASVAVYWNESVVLVPWSGAVAMTVEPLAASATVPADGPVEVNVSVSFGSGSVTSAARSIVSGVPASTGRIV